MTSVLMPICLVCRHFQRGPGYRCKAYPDGIPEPIIDNAADHREPYDGDGGIQFAPKDRDAAKIAADLIEWANRD